MAKSTLVVIVVIIVFLFILLRKIKKSGSGEILHISHSRDGGVKAKITKGGETIWQGGVDMK